MPSFGAQGPKPQRICRESSEAGFERRYRNFTPIRAPYDGARVARLVVVEDEIELIMRDRVVNLEASPAFGNVVNDAFDRGAGEPDDLRALQRLHPRRFPPLLPGSPAVLDRRIEVGVGDSTIFDGGYFHGPTNIAVKPQL